MKNRYKQADNKQRRPLSIHMRHRLREGLFLLSIACAIFLFISLVTYHHDDPGWTSTGLGSKVLNWGGRVGAWVADIFLSLFGIVAYLFPLLMILSSCLGLKEREVETKKNHEWIYKAIGWIILISSACALAGFYFKSDSRLPASGGGIMGDLLSTGLSLSFNKTGSTLLLITTLLCGITLVTGLSWLAVIDVIGEYLYQYLANLRTYFKQKETKTLAKAEPVIDKKS